MTGVTIDPKDSRPYFAKAAKTWEEIEKKDGAWDGWGNKGNAVIGIRI